MFLVYCFHIPDDKVNSLYNKRPENINCKYIKGYRPNVIDVTKPFYYEKVDNLRNHQSSIQMVLENFKLDKIDRNNYCLFTNFIITSIVQRIYNRKRVSEFFQNESNDLLHMYEHEHEVGGGEEEEQQQYHSSVFADISNKVDDEQETLVEDIYDAMNWKVSHSSTFPPIRLDHNQSYIVEKIKYYWLEKYPIIIRHTKRYSWCCYYKAL